MLIIGHRGASSLEPENTIRSFKKAEELGVDMIEMDLRLTLDNQIVISHDDNLKRIFGIDKSIRKSTLGELKDISIAKGREIPTLKEALSSVVKPLNLHIKVVGLEKSL